MYAATVTGSPVENACRLIKKYEPEGRGYYGAALAVLGAGVLAAIRVNAAGTGDRTGVLAQLAAAEGVGPGDVVMATARTSGIARIMSR